MKKFLAVIVTMAILTIGYFALFPVGQRPDRTFDTRVAHPGYVSVHPAVVFDEAHYNAHTVNGSYRPFAELLQNDGYTLRTNRKPFTADTFQGVAVLVIVNAAGGSNPKLFGFNLVPLRKGQRDAPAFTAAEIEAVRQWVSSGGALLLVADHYPFGPSASNLAAAFGVTMHGGFAEVPVQYRGKEDAGSIEFSRSNGLLADLPITNGRSASERVDRVLSFTGQSLDAPNGIELLKLPASAVEYVPPPPQFEKQLAGKTQAAVVEYGKGRVVVIGEAGMLTAQIDQGFRFGMNVAGTHNRQFTLNVMHWLSRLF